MTPTATTFTATAEPQSADRLRAARDLTDADIRAEYAHAPTPDEIAAYRAEDATTCDFWVAEAVRAASSRALSQAADARTGLGDFTLTVEVTDLVATATVVLR